MVKEGELQITNSLSDAKYIKFAKSHERMGVTAGRLYDIEHGVIDLAIGLEPFIIDDYGRPNIAALLCCKGELYK